LFSPTQVPMIERFTADRTARTAFGPECLFKLDTPHSPFHTRNRGYPWRLSPNPRRRTK
jgi:hypothetical protein